MKYSDTSETPVDTKYKPDFVFFPAMEEFPQWSNVGVACELKAINNRDGNALNGQIGQYFNQMWRAQPRKLCIGLVAFLGKLHILLNTRDVMNHAVVGTLPFVGHDNRSIYPSDEYSKITLEPGSGELVVRLLAMMFTLDFDQCGRVVYPVGTTSWVHKATTGNVTAFTKCNILVFEDCGVGISQYVQDLAQQPSANHWRLLDIVCGYIHTIYAAWSGSTVRILHRDISSGNLMVRANHAMVIDWEYALQVSTSERRQCVSSHPLTGTLVYASMGVLGGGNMRSAIDDIESLFYVLAHVIESAQYASDGYNTKTQSNEKCPYFWCDFLLSMYSILDIGRHTVASGIVIRSTSVEEYVRQLVLALSPVLDKYGAEAKHFTQLFKRNSTSRMDSFGQLIDYTRNLYANQLNRRFAWTPSVCGTNVYDCLFHHDGVRVSTAMDLTTIAGRKDFVSLLVNWSLCETSKLGYNPSVRIDPATRTGEIDCFTDANEEGGKQKHTYSVKDVISISTSVFGRHTQCFLASPKNVNDRHVAIKDAWPLAVSRDGENLEKSNEIEHLKLTDEKLRNNSKGVLYSKIVMAGTVRIKHGQKEIADKTFAIFADDSAKEYA
ncbi:hypothetical protein GGI11_002603, partial [Coemansia sp. RSA 2049]